jgi:hypothetical protein
MGSEALNVRFGRTRRTVAARAIGALVLCAVALPALAPAVSAGGCGACDDDGDGLTNEQEYAVYGTALDNPDSDGDGVFDGYEVSSGLSPLSRDTDFDGLSDYDELSQADYVEPGSGDADGDGLTDGYEGQVSLTDIYNPDTDGDTLTDSVEVHTTGTDPLRADSEGDGMLDYCDREPWVFNVDNDSGAAGALFGGAMGCGSIS